jgi:glycine cleavage system T protein/queuosine biosynthesis protein QueC
MEAKKAVCLVSGGLDSAVAAALAAKEGYDLYFLVGDYGQVTNTKEVACARALAGHFQARQIRVIDLGWLRDMGGSGLTSPKIYLSPENADLEYVPFRNTILLAAAVAWAEVIGAEAVFIGSTGPPWHTPDNSPEYFQAFQEVVRIGTKKKDIMIRAPFCQSKKRDVVQTGINLGVPFHLTWSCHNYEDIACGDCSNCRDRLHAFQELGIEDPIPYYHRSRRWQGVVLSAVTYMGDTTSIRQRFLFDEDLSRIDPFIADIVSLEEARQTNRISLMAASSICPRAVLIAQASVFSNIDAEGYPPERMSSISIARLMQIDEQLAYYRRYGDSRSNKGTELANVVEALAQKRIAALFATDWASHSDLSISAEQIHANVQCPTGSIANNAVYNALLRPGDAILSLRLTHGGHLTHGSELHTSGKVYKSFFYEVDPETGRLDYDEIYHLAVTHKPRLIIGGASSYPWDIEWRKLREIANSLSSRTYVLADISHPAGLVAAGLFPNPIGYADVVTFTTYKTLCGPRGAVILTTDPGIANAIDRAVFPGQQGAPLLQQIVGIAVAAKLARTPEFKRLQRAILDNARYLADTFSNLGVKVAFGGTNSHMIILDLKGVHPYLKGNVPVRILDTVGIVCNSNIIPGDTIPALASGLRLGTTWITQMGFTKPEIRECAEIIHDVLVNIKPFYYQGLTREIPRGKIPADVLRSAKSRVVRVLESVRAQTGCTSAIVESPTVIGKPNDQDEVVKTLVSPAPDQVYLEDLSDKLTVLEIVGDRDRATAFLQEVTSVHVNHLSIDQARSSLILYPNGKVMSEVIVLNEGINDLDRQKYLLVCEKEQAAQLAEWLKFLSDGYVEFDSFDILKKIEGPVVVHGPVFCDLTDMERHRDGHLAFAVFGRNAHDLLEKHLSCKLQGSPFAVTRVDTPNGWVRILHVEYSDGRSAFEILGTGHEIETLWNALTAESCVFLLKNKSSKSQSQRLEKDGIVCEARYRHEHLLSPSKPYFVGRPHVINHFSKKERPHFIFSDPRSEGDDRPVLYDWHVSQGARLAHFAGWLMPLWYSSARTEHRAVRTTGGLFDLSHMGILRFTGAGACRFLDLVLTNYVPWLEVGRSQYTFVLKPDGSVLDDCILYRLGADDFMLVLNAANSQRVMEWFKAVASKQYAIDLYDLAIEVDADCQIMDLKADDAGRQKRIILALQGSASLSILKGIAGDPDEAQYLGALKRGEIRPAILGGIDTLVARTGYTGEPFGYEIFVHPNSALHLWELLLLVGKQFDLVPVGLAARDSLRTEAGFPLFGHELAGPHRITPIEAGYGAFVKMHKPFFIGRQALLKSMGESNRRIMRFEVEAKFRRPVRAGNIVANKDGTYIGYVTSCAYLENHQIGLAIVDRHLDVGAPIYILSHERQNVSTIEAYTRPRFLSDEKV